MQFFCSLMKLRWLCDLVLLTFWKELSSSPSRLSTWIDWGLRERCKRVYFVLRCGKLGISRINCSRLLDSHRKKMAILTEKPRNAQLMNSFRKSNIYWWATREIRRWKWKFSLIAMEADKSRAFKLSPSRSVSKCHMVSRLVTCVRRSIQLNWITISNNYIMITISHYLASFDMRCEHQFSCI